MFKRILFLTALTLSVGAAGAYASGSPAAAVHKLCVGIQGGDGVSRGDLSILHDGLGRICIVGKQGHQGARGPTGPAGQDGVDGAPGQDGVDGIDGVDGKDGARGERGPAGPQGEPGPQGPQGEPGQDGADGTITGTVPVCASPGGNLKVCGGDNGHDTVVGYLSLVNSAS